MFEKLFKEKSTSLVGAAAIIGFFSLASRLVGIIRNRILAGQFGAGDQLDIYYAAFRIPDTIFNLLILGALSAGFIPVFSEYLSHKKNKEAWYVANGILNLLLVGLGIFIVIFFFLAPYLMPLITPGFEQEKINSTVALTRIMLLSPVFFALSNIAGGILNSFKRFFVYSLAPIMYNLGIIGGAIFFAPQMGISGVAWGVVLGAFLHFLVQLPSIWHLGFRYQWIFDIYHSGIRQIGKLMVPRTLALATVQINLFIITILASTISSGSLTIFNLAQDIQSFPLGIFGISFAIAAFPTFSSLVAQNQNHKFVEAFSQTVRQVLFFIIPISVLFFVLRQPLVKILLETGKFTSEDSSLTMITLGFFSLSLFAQSLIPLLARVFYAFKDSKTPFFIALVSNIANIILSLILIEYFRVAGLALAFSGSNILSFVLLWKFAKKKIRFLDEPKILASGVKITLAALIAGIISGVSLSNLTSLISGDSLSSLLIRLILSAIAGLGVFLAVTWLLKSEELFGFKKMLWEKLFRH